MSDRLIDTVIFDVGGVLAANGRHADFASRFPHADPEVVTRIFVGDYGEDGDHPWHRLERGEITLEENRRLNRAALEAAGIELKPPPPGAPVTVEFTRSEPMVALVEELRAAGLRLGVLTNNVLEFRDRWRVHDGERLVHAEAFALGPQVARQMSRPGTATPSASASRRGGATALIAGDAPAETGTPAHRSSRSARRT